MYAACHPLHLASTASTSAASAASAAAAFTSPPPTVRSHHAGVAAASGHLELVELLLEHQAPVDAADGNGNAPLLFAAHGGHSQLVRALLQARQPDLDHHHHNHRR